MVIPNQGVANYVTQWVYDSWNRLKYMTYPDGEVVNYSYNLGGMLNRVTGTKSGTNTVYVDDIRYDKFEQRTLLKYGNGTQTDYTYNPLNRMMNTLKVQKGSTVLMNNAYTYDAVQNITGIVSSNITQGAIGGSMSHQYRYDNLNRLDSAWGSFVGPNSKMADYTLGLSYDNLHNITRKTQDIVQQNLKFDGILNSGYNLSYTYADNSQQIANIADASYRADRSGGAYGTGRQQTDVLNEKAQSFTYDANGNMTYVATGKKLNDSTLQATSSRQLLWDEENRLLAISDNGYVSNYWYDAAGERTVKQSGGSEGVFVNGVFSGGSTKSGKFIAYISPYMVVSNGGNYSKHIYMGSQRIVSKLSNSGIFAASPVTVTDQQARYAFQTSKIKERFDSLGLIYKGLTRTGGLISSIPDTTASSYFYHPDHLGSSSLITDGTGALTQHIQYVPFGEVFVEERTNSWSTPYKFNGKELDEETGLYYYHARYYDPGLSVWLSVDPLAEKYPNWSSYVYTFNDPVNYTDPDGKRGRPARQMQSNNRNIRYGLLPNGQMPLSYRRTTNYLLTSKSNGTRPIIPESSPGKPYPEYLRLINTSGGNSVQVSPENNVGRFMIATIEYIYDRMNYQKEIFKIYQDVRYNENGIKKSPLQIILLDPVLISIQSEYNNAVTEINNKLGPIDYSTAESLVDFIQIYSERQEAIQKEIGLSPIAVIQLMMMRNPDFFKSSESSISILPEIRNASLP
jgi:RHS repeat-associated protein